MKLAQKILGGSLVAVAVGAATPAMAGKVLDGVKQRDQLVCGVHTGRAGFALADGSGKWSGLDKKWAYRIVKQVGNYGESFERNLGSKSPLKLDRGMNRLYTEGGLVYPLPLQ